MGGFSVILGANSDARDSSVCAADKSFQEQGLAHDRRIASSDYCVDLYKKYSGASCAFYDDVEGDGFCAALGTFIYQGSTGKDAARKVYCDFDGSHIPYTDSIGSYCILVYKHSSLFLWIDQLGLYKAFLSRSRIRWASSFLAVLANDGERSIDEQSLYEYVFQGTTYGNKTVARGVTLAEPGTLYDLIRSVEFQSTEFWPGRSSTDCATVFENCLATSRRIFDSIDAANFRTVDSALSGGFDSRLILALLLERGATPRLHVYGSVDSPDVRIAKLIGAGLGLHINHEDKSKEVDGVTLDWPAIVRRNFMAFDGMPTDSIFDNGSDFRSRQRRASGEALMLNGGGGEVFRNFFYLRDRKYSVSDIVSSFYSQYSRGLCTEKFSENRYREKLKTDIKSCLRAGDGDLSRRQVEMIYPLFRLRFWMGKNNSINNRFGWTVTPFSEPEVVASALRIPISEKNSGRFEARMIRSIYPRLSEFTSNYGHNFANDPPIRTRLKSQLNLSRPIWMRRHSYHLKQKYVATMAKSYPCISAINACMPNGLEVMQEYFLMRRVKDPAIIARVATVEYMCQNGYFTQFN
jgi:asparagine synthase (glutamine-hydrolysing)